VTEKGPSPAEPTEALLEPRRQPAVADPPDTRPRWRAFLSGWRFWVTALAGVMLGVLVVSLGRRGLVSLVPPLVVVGGFLYVLGATLYVLFVVPMSGRHPDTPEGRASRLEDRAVMISIPLVFAVIVLVWIWRGLLA
jgi:hypothetical protein